MQDSRVPVLEKVETATAYSMRMGIFRLPRREGKRIFLLGHCVVQQQIARTAREQIEPPFAFLEMPYREESSPLNGESSAGIALGIQQPHAPSVGIENPKPPVSTAKMEGLNTRHHVRL